MLDAPSKAEPSDAPKAGESIWDETHVKALLALPRHPQQLLVEPPFAEWIATHGGLAAVRRFLLEVPLFPTLRSLLEVIVAQPGESINHYINRLHISERAYSNYLRDLVVVLASALDHWGTAAGVVRGSAFQRRLPRPLTSLVGADNAVMEVSQCLRAPEARLITITGPGGMGKTRLAIAVAQQMAEQFRDGVCFVALETTDDAGLVHVEIARALGVETNSERTLYTALLDSLRSSQMLLILDNFEQVMPAAKLVSEMLRSAPELRVIVTSREPLQLYGENCYCVPSLSLPRSDAIPLTEWEQYSAVRLFVERARASSAEFRLSQANLQYIVQICRRLDGLPLAIELAAARVLVFSPQQLLRMLLHDATFFNRGPQGLPPRQRSPWQLMDWSYQLLSPLEQTILRRLAVFSADCSVEAATFVTAVPETPECIEALIRKNLLRPVHLEFESEQLRVTMLQIGRAYAQERLAQSGEETATRERLLEYYVSFAEVAEQSIGTREHTNWLQRVEHEHDNLRSALQWAVDQRQFVLALRITGCVWRFWQMLNLLSEGRHWLELILENTAQARSLDRIKNLWGAGWLATSQGENVSVAHPLFMEGLALARELGEQRAVGWLLHGLVDTYFSQKQIQASFQAQEEAHAIFTSLNDQEEVAWGLDMRGRCLLGLQMYDEACSSLEQAIAIFRRMDHPWGLGWTLFHLGHVLQQQGDYQAAQIRFEESLCYLGHFGTRWQLAWALSYTGYNLLLCDRLSQAAPLLAQSIDLHVEMHNHNGWFETIRRIVQLAIRQGNYSQAVQLESALRNTPANLEDILVPQSDLEPIPADLRPAWQELGAGAYGAAWYAGKQMVPAQIFDLSSTILRQPF